MPDIMPRKYTASTTATSAATLSAKLKRMPEDARMKLKDSLTRIINESSGGLICIIL